MEQSSEPCPKCGTALDTPGMGGLCPRCVALDFFSPSDFGAGTESVERTELFGDEERRIGGYELIQELGRGGMGVVYRARQGSLGREVAVKFLLHGVLAGDAAIARFRAEAEAVARLRHPHIVAIFEVGEERGRHFHAMELVCGRSLAECLRDGPMSVPRAASYLKRVAEALQHAHERGVLHRDLKPANILIDERDEPRVTDFGLAKQVGSADGRTKSDDSQLTLSGQVVGTPAYISPEQAGASRAADARSDVYSLGAVLYHLVTGRPPFLGESSTNILRQVAETEPVALRLLNPSLPRDLETICLKCLEKEPGRRYANARELAEDLDRFLKDEPIRARPVVPVERAWRWCKRKPALAAAMAGIALLLAGIALISTASARRIEVLRLGALTNLYASDMRLAQQAIAESKFGAATELLERHRPHAGDPDLRGFEWRHFQEHCRSDEAAALDRHGAQIQRVAFSPDGRFFATASGEVQVWETTTRRRLWTFQAGDFVWALAFSPDSSALLVGDGRNSVFRFDVAPHTGTSAGSHRFAGLTNLPARPIAFFWPGGELGLRIVTQQGLFTWDGVSARPGPGFEAPFPRAQVTLDGSAAAVLVSPQRIRAWTLNPPALRVEYSVPAPARAVAVSPDGRWLAAGDYSGALRFWELNAPHRTNVVAAHRGLVECIAFSPDGSRLASAGADQIIRFTDLATGAALGRWQGHRGTVMALAFSPQGDWLVSGDKLGETKLWKVHSPSRDSKLPPDVRGFISADGARAVFCAMSNVVAIHDTTSSAAPPHRIPAPHDWSFLPSAKGVAAVDPQGGLHALQPDGSWRDVPLPGLTIRPGGALSPDGSIVCLHTREFKGPLVWDLSQGKEILRVADEPTWMAPTFSSDGRRLACGSIVGRARVWEIPSGREIATFMAHKNYAYACDLSPDGRRLATAGFDGLVKLWEVDDARLLGEYRSSADAYWTVALAPDGRRIAAGTSESSIVIWDVPSRQEVATFQLGEPLGPVEGMLRFTPDGTALLHAKGALRQWTAPPLN